MRGLVGPALLALLFGSVLGLGFSRPRAPHAAPSERVSLEAPEGDADGGVVDGGGAGIAAADAAPPASAPKLRVGALAVEHVAAFAAASGRPEDAVADATVLADPDGLRAAFVAGAEAGGVDALVVPLGTAVREMAALRALEPRIVHVLAEAPTGATLALAPGRTLAELARAQDVPLAATLEPAGLDLALFGLAHAGASLEHARRVVDGGAPAVAIHEPGQGGGWLGADVDRLAPLVLVVPRGRLDAAAAPGAAVRRAVAALREGPPKDLAAAARALAEGRGLPLKAPARPDAVALVGALGALTFLDAPAADARLAPGGCGVERTARGIAARLREAGLLERELPAELVDARFASPPAPRPELPAVDGGAFDAGTSAAGRGRAAVEQRVRARPVEPSLDAAADLVCAASRGVLVVRAKEGADAAAALVGELRARVDGLAAERIVAAPDRPAGDAAASFVLELPR